MQNLPKQAAMFNVARISNSPLRFQYNIRIQFDDKSVLLSSCEQVKIVQFVSY